jgi:hypothetical protein
VPVGRGEVRSVPGAASSAGVHPERGRNEGSPERGRSHRSICAQAGPGASMGADIRREQPRVPPRTESPHGARRGARVSGRRPRMDGGHRPVEVLRPGPPPTADGSGGVALFGPSAARGPRADPARGGGAAGRHAGQERRGGPARRPTFASPEQHRAGRARPRASAARTPFCALRG